MRDYYPKKLPFLAQSQEEVRRVAFEINERPKEVLGNASPLSLHKEILKCRPPLLYDSPDSENSHEAVSSAGEEAIVSTLEIVRNLDTME